jgi:hypothetical protein
MREGAPAFYRPVAPAVLPPVGFNALDQGQSSADSTKPAFTGFVSTYAITEASSLLVRIHRSKYSRCQKGWALLPMRKDRNYGELFHHEAALQQRTRQFPGSAGIEGHRACDPTADHPAGTFFRRRNPERDMPVGLWKRTGQPPCDENHGVLGSPMRKSSVPEHNFPGTGGKTADATDVVCCQVKILKRNRLGSA